MPEKELDSVPSNGQQPLPLSPRAMAPHSLKVSREGKNITSKSSSATTILFLHFLDKDALDPDSSVPLLEVGLEGHSPSPDLFPVQRGENPGEEEGGLREEHRPCQGHPYGQGRDKSKVRETALERMASTPGQEGNGDGVTQRGSR